MKEEYAVNTENFSNEEEALTGPPEEGGSGEKGSFDEAVSIMSEAAANAEPPDSEDEEAFGEEREKSFGGIRPADITACLRKSKKARIAAIAMVFIVICSILVPAVQSSRLKKYYAEIEENTALIDENNEKIKTLDKELEELDSQIESLTGEKDTLTAHIEELEEFRSYYGELNEEADSDAVTDERIAALKSENESYIAAAKLLINNDAEYLGINAYVSTEDFSPMDYNQYFKDLAAGTAVDAVTDAVLGNTIVGTVLDIKDKAELIENIFSSVSSMSDGQESSVILEHLSDIIVENNQQLQSFLTNANVTETDFKNCVQCFDNIRQAFNDLNTNSNGKINPFENCDEEYNSLYEIYEKYKANIQQINDYESRRQ